MDRLTEERQHIDELDALLLKTLAERMDVSRRIGEYKAESGIEVLQPARYASMMEKRFAKGRQLHLDHNFISALFDLIHTESQHIQTDIINHKSPKKQV